MIEHSLAMKAHPLVLHDQPGGQVKSRPASK